MSPFTKQLPLFTTLQQTRQDKIAKYNSFHGVLPPIFLILINLIARDMPNTQLTDIIGLSLTRTTE